MTKRRVGRPVDSGRHAAKTAASEQARRRLALIMETLTGQVPVGEAAAQMGVSEAHFHRLRDRAMEGAAGALEERPRGRPRKAPAVDSEEERLRREVTRLKLELNAAQIREELAILMPGVMKRPEAVEGKKRRRGGRRK